MKSKKEKNCTWAILSLTTAILAILPIAIPFVLLKPLAFIFDLIFKLTGIILPYEFVVQFFSFLAIICGIVALIKMKKNPLLKGKGMAITGIVLGIIWLLYTRGIVIY